MRIRNLFATLCCRNFSTPTRAHLRRPGAAPTTVNVRIEGEAQTLFEGPVLGDPPPPHGVKATSDTAVTRRCDGINRARPLEHARNPTPTSASVDAMSLDRRNLRRPAVPRLRRLLHQALRAGRTKRRQILGILVNNTFTNVGGCQYQVDGGDEVLWAFDAFQGRPRISLYPGGYSGGGVPLTAQATLGVPFAVEVDSWDGYNESEPPASPTRSTTGFEGATVAPVTTAANGFQKVETGSSGAGGKASVRHQGWRGSASPRPKR